MHWRSAECHVGGRADIKAFTLHWPCISLALCGLHGRVLHGSRVVFMVSAHSSLDERSLCFSWFGALLLLMSRASSCHFGHLTHHDGVRSARGRGVHPARRPGHPPHRSMLSRRVTRSRAWDLHSSATTTGHDERGCTRLSSTTERTSLELRTSAIDRAAGALVTSQEPA